MTASKTMDKGQLIAVCICFVLMTLIASITLGVIPVYVVRLGADSGTTGLYLAFNFLAVTVGNIAGGSLTDRIGQHKRVTLVSYLLWIPAALLIIQATTVVGVILTSGLMWLIGGVAIAALTSITGLSAGEDERGSVFGWVGLAGSLGGLLAGLIGGSMADKWGFSSLFVTMAALAGIMFFITLYIRDVEAIPTARQPKHEAGAEKGIQPSVGIVIYIFLLVNLIARVGVSASDLGRPLVMLHLGMDTTAVSNAIAVSSAVTLPLPLIMGWLSDRIGRKRLLITCFGVGAAGVLILIGASVPWQFWLSAALTSLVNASTGVGQAYTADLSDPKIVGRSLSLYNSSNFISGIIGLGGAGYVMQAIGLNSTLVLGACLLGTGILFLLRMRPAAPKLVVDMVEAAT